MDVGNFAACEEHFVLVGRRQRDGSRIAPLSIQQVRRTIADAAGSRNIFRSSRHEHVVRQVIGTQNRLSLARRRATDADLVVGGNMGVLEIRLHHPVLRSMRINHVVDGAVVLGHWRSKRVVAGMSQVPAGNETQAVGSVKCVRDGPRQSVPAVGIEAIVPCQ